MTSDGATVLCYVGARHFYCKLTVLPPKQVVLLTLAI